MSEQITVELKFSQSSLNPKITKIVDSIGTQLSSEYPNSKIRVEAYCCVGQAFGYLFHGCSVTGCSPIKHTIDDSDPR